MLDPAVLELQERIAHQELAIDELTRQALAQVDLIRRLEERVVQLETQLVELAGQVGQEIDDAPPPHY